MLASKVARVLEYKWWLLPAARCEWVALFLLFQWRFTHARIVRRELLAVSLLQVASWLRHFATVYSLSLQRLNALHVACYNFLKVVVQDFTM